MLNNGSYLDRTTNYDKSMEIWLQRLDRRGFKIEDTEKLFRSSQEKFIFDIKLLLTNRNGIEGKFLHLHEVKN